MSYTVDDVQGHISAAVKQMKLALEAEQRLK